MVASVLAVTMALRCGSTRTAVPSRMVCVHAATKLSTLSGSSRGALGSSGNAPFGL